MIEIPTVDQLDVRQKRVFYRVDYNVPMEAGRISDTTRIDETLATLKILRERDAKIIIASHMGRPKGSRNPEFSLQPVRDKLSEILGAEILWAGDCIGPDVERLAQSLPPAGILMIENLRFHPGEEKNDREFALKLRSLADVYVNDAFGASHRAHASIVALPELFERSQRAGGLLLARELEFLQRITDVSDRPFVAILGGAKIAGKIEPLEAMVKLADEVLIGGGMANTFLAAQGMNLGASLVDVDSIEIAKRILAGGHRAAVTLPEDVVVTDSLEKPTQVRTVDVRSIAAGEMAVDIGPRTSDTYAKRIAGAKTIFWNGPMGVFEQDQFAKGTRTVAEAIARSGAVSVVGGGESVEAIKQSGHSERITHISTGGGASLEFISGIKLPGIEVLRK